MPRITPYRLFAAAVLVLQLPVLAPFPACALLSGAVVAGLEACRRARRALEELELPRPLVARRRAARA